MNINSGCLARAYRDNYASCRQHRVKMLYRVEGSFPADDNESML